MKSSRKLSKRKWRKWAERISIRSDMKLTEGLVLGSPSIYLVAGFSSPFRGTFQLLLILIKAGPDNYSV